MMHALDVGQHMEKIQFCISYKNTLRHINGFTSFRLHATSEFRNKE